MKKLPLITKVALIALLALFTACSDPVPILSVRGELVDWHLNGTHSQEEIISRITEFDGTAVAHYDVTFYSLTYCTEYLGKPIKSAGLLIIPNDIDTARLIMYCHGTEIPLKLLGANKITPSLYTGDAETHRDVRNMGLGWASAGYVVFMPDYIGYGLTLGEDHPYLCFTEMFKSNIDGLLAAKSFIAKEALVYDNNLFIAGWSQGAGAALSAHKYIQEDYSSDFTVLASSGLAGPYNLEKTALETLKNKDTDMPILPIISWGIYSINKFSSVQRPTDQLYTYPVFDQMSSMLVPSNKPAKVFNAVFLAGLLNGSDVAFLQEFNRNSFCSGWKPTGKVFLHHGDADRVVPFYNSTDAYDGLTAESADVTFYTYPNGDHDTDLGNFILNTLHDFNSIK